MSDDTLSPEERDAARTMRETIAGQDDAGLSLRTVASLLGVSPATVLRDLRRSNPDHLGDEDSGIEVGKVMGRDGKVRPSRRIDTTDRDDEIRRLRAAGHSIRAIASEVGCSVGTVHRVLASEDRGV